MVLSHTATGTDAVSCMPLPGNKRAIAAAVELGWADVFHSTMRAHIPTDTRRWLDSDKPYYVRWKRWYEPYIIVNASLRDMPAYDVRFVDRGANKVIWTHMLALRGFSFVVLPSPFVLHSWETPAREKATRRGMFPERASLYKSIIDNEKQWAAARGIAPQLLRVYAPYRKLEEHWRPARATITRGVMQSKQKTRLTVAFDAWDEAALDASLANVATLVAAAAGSS
jgi:hypothetical protein